MKENLYRTPFDQYQRYASCSRVIEALPESFYEGYGFIIDIGGRDGSFFKFLQNNKIKVVADREIDTLDHSILFIRADIGNLPFINKTVDISVSLDTLEHIKYTKRSVSMLEIQRITKEFIILSFPQISQENEFLENLFFNIIKNIQNKEDVFLHEHIKNILPSRADIESWLNDDVKSFFHFGANNSYIWFLMSVLKRMISCCGYDCIDFDLSKEIDLFYNRFLSLNDNLPPHYRVFSVISFLEVDPSIEETFMQAFSNGSESLLKNEDLAFFAINYSISSLKADSNHMNNLYKLMLRYEKHFEGFQRMMKKKESAMEFLIRENNTLKNDIRKFDSFLYCIYYYIRSKYLRIMNKIKRTHTRDPNHL